MISAKLPLGLFVTGTDTNVGKTYVSAFILRSLRSQRIRVGAYKPVCSGAIVDGSLEARWQDVEELREALAVDVPDDAISPQRFLAALAPPMAAQREGRTIDSARLVTGLEWWVDRAEIVVVEGVGGLLAPVTDSETIADFVCSIRYPLIVVARCGLGTINHTLLTLEAARNRSLRVCGIVLNQCRPDDDRSIAEENAREIEIRGGVPVLGILDWGSADGLHRHGRAVTIRWQELIIQK